MIYQQFCQCLFFFVTWLMRSLDWNLRTTMMHDMIACYCEAYFSMLSSWWFDSDTLISQFPTFSATIMIISYDNDILIFDINSVIKIISRYYHSIITKISVKYQNINNQTNDILSWYFDKPQYCTLVVQLCLSKKSDNLQLPGRVLAVSKLNARETYDKAQSHITITTSNAWCWDWIAYIKL